MRKIGCTYSLQVFLFALLLCLAAPLSLAGTVRDNFDSPKLNSDIWEVVTEGDGTHSVKDGQLILESPDVPSGVVLYFSQEILGDVTVEIQMDPTNVDPGTQGSVGFTDGIFAPEPSPDLRIPPTGLDDRVYQ